MSGRSPKAKAGTRKLSEVAKKLVQPSGLAGTYWNDVGRVCREKLGLGFDAWQDGAARLILAHREDGNLACMIGGVGMSLPRQVGKTYLISAIVFGLCIMRPGTLVIWSAHHGKTHGETFLGMQEFCQRVKVRPYIKQVFTGSGDEEVRFTNGSRILFGAREHGFGRGIPGVDVIVSDEAQIMSDKALDAQLATMNTSDFGLAIYVGTPPLPEDKSEAFTRMRTDAWSGEMEDSVWIELGADDGFKPTLRPAPLTAADWEQIEKANPSFPHRTPAQSIERLRRKLSPESFLREGAGVWDESSDRLHAFPPGSWSATGIAEPDPEWPLAAVGLDMNMERTRISLGVAARSEAGVHLEVALDADYSDTGAEAVVDWVYKRARRRLPVVIDSFSPARSLEPLLKAKGCKVWVLSSAEFGQACMALHDSVRGGAVTHFAEQSALSESVAGACKEPLGKAGAWKFSRTSVDVELHPLMSVTCAHYGAIKSKPRKAASGDSGRVVVL